MAIKPPDYTSVMTTIVCALLIWFGSQTVDTQVKLTRIEADVLNIRQNIQDNNNLRQVRDADIEQRLRALEHYKNEQARLQERVPRVSQ